MNVIKQQKIMWCVCVWEGKRESLEDTLMNNKINGDD